MGLSVVMPIAYDWLFAIRSIGRIWDVADEVIVGVDSDGVTWSGTKFTFDEYTFLAGLVAHLKGDLTKLKFIQHPFSSLEYEHPHINRIKTFQYWQQQSPANKIQTLERNYLTLQAKPGNWIVQLDADEELLDPIGFRDWLPPPNPDLYIRLPWLNVFKLIDEYALVIADDPPPMTRVAFADPGNLLIGRAPKYGAAVDGPFRILHWTIGGRSEADIRQKMSAFSHAGEKNIDDFIAMWKSVNLDNYETPGAFNHFNVPLPWKVLHAIPLQALMAL